LGKGAAALAMTAAALLAAAGPASGAVDGSSSGGSVERGSRTGEVVRHWNAVAGEAATAACIAPTDNPLSESHAYAMAQVAVHDALNAIERRFEPYAYDGQAPRTASLPVAVASATRDVLVPTLLAIPEPFPASCGQAGAQYVEEQYQRALAAVPDGPEKSAGLAVGQAAASAVLALRTGDGSDQPLADPTFQQGTAPGQWRFTPGVPFAFGPSWSEVEPFVLDGADQFRPPPPPSLDSAQYTSDYLEVKRLGGDGVATASQRTPDQTEIARFWVESSPLAWNRIARGVAASRHLDAWSTARLLGLLNMALADTYVASFETKYHYLFWRPVTAIREAGADGNPATEPDPTWTPLVTTPPIPDYESAHAAEGAAAAAVLRGVLHTDRVRFETCSLTVPVGQRCSDPQPVWRSFRSFTQAAQENGDSRVLVGFHFRTAVDRGLELGTSVGDRAVTTRMGRVGRDG
jgi:hypothetical protein